MIDKELALGERYAAIKKLQERLLRGFSDPRWTPVYEKALDLALNEKRAETPHFYYRLLDDAKRSLRRDRQRGPALASFYIEGRNGAEVLDETIAVDHDTPEDLLNIKQEIELIREFCRTRHRFSLAIFHFMLEGYTVAQTAERLDISMSMVKKLRAEIIRKAETIITF